MVLFSFLTKKNVQQINDTVLTLTVINYKSVVIGLHLLTIGTFLGAIWANESWGRYWAWDPKETWSLITMFAYAFLAHSTLFKPLKNVFTYNALSLFAFFFVLMTYFGVNYYLSGLHSHAGGDPVPIPAFVYYLVFSLIGLLFYARYRLRMD